VLARVISVIAVASLIALVAVACGGGAEPYPTAQPESPPPPPPVPTAGAVGTEPTTPPSAAVDGGAGTALSVTVGLNDGGGLGPYVFEPADLTFKQGDQVTFTLVGESQFHTFTIDELGIDVEVDGGATVNFEQTFDKPGTYALICIPHEGSGMVGTITVEAAEAGAGAPEPESAPPEAAAPVRSSMTVALDDGGGRGPFAFEPTDFTFSAGETVEFTFVSGSQFHTFTVDDLGIDVEVDGGATVNFEQTFDKPGTYTLICIPHEGSGMVGTITVQ